MPYELPRDPSTARRERISRWIGFAFASAIRPVLLVAGGLDDSVGADGPRRLEAAARDGGSPVELHVREAAGHDQSPRPVPGGLRVLGGRLLRARLPDVRLTTLPTQPLRASMRAQETSRPVNPSSSDADARFDRTVDRWFRDQLAMHPEWATSLGLHDRDAELPAGGRDAVEEEVAFHRRTIDEMSAFDPSELTPGRALDRDLAIHESRLRLFHLTDYRAWAGSSSAAADIGDALFPLFTRDFAPLRDRLESMAGRLEQAPRYLVESRERVTEPVRIWTEIDVESTRQLPGFLDTVLAAARAEAGDERLMARLTSAVAGTKAALAEHLGWLRDDVLPRASADWKTGPDRFEELLRLRELGADGDEILAVGEELLASEQAAREALLAEIEPGASAEEVADIVKNDHAATFAEALNEYRVSMDRARDFVLEHRLATPPAEDHLNVIETPAFIRHLIPFAAYYDPAKFDPVPVGTYIVTPPSEPSMMREHNRSSISNTSVHEAYPGHQLQLSAAITNPSLVRAFSDAPEFAEGWAFYGERLMKEQGFDDTPKGWYTVHTDAIWRATRIILDVQLHRGVIGFDEAVDRLVAETGFERPAAVAEVKRYTSSPTYQLSYLYGRHMIERLKADVRAHEGAGFDLRRFHDTLIYGGNLPVSYARRLFDLEPA